jgi:LmbE family N-acetylglucosaminyl deacetylase
MMPMFRISASDLSNECPKSTVWTISASDVSGRAMIIPIVQEAEWMSVLSDLPRWQPPEKPTVVISPHPDDETLGSGGLIARLRSNGIDVMVIAVTDGENAYEDEGGLGEIREREQTNGLGKLGVDPPHIIRFRFPDSGLRDCEERLIEVLQSIVSANAHVIAPWRFDFHPDHEVCGRAAEAIAREKDIQLTSYFFWTWHRGDRKMLDGLQLVSLPLEPDEIRAKLNALRCHQSQLKRADGYPILPDFLLGPARRSFEVFLPA